MKNKKFGVLCPEEVAAAAIEAWIAAGNDVGIHGALWMKNKPARFAPA
ncbi:MULTISPECIES: hypothetical protein [Bifidobacterium]|nr:MULTISPECIES: hypothetical protein [Bifidobacterium]MBH9981077.1 hypothetical protein [Bifidobacterium asteroides]MBI0100343.1 hypothetical protein [Bifidobacterium sp. W8114]